jgi:two-component system nitrogen regulation sensor histidine kinase GlnL
LFIASIIYKQLSILTQTNENKAMVTSPHYKTVLDNLATAVLLIDDQLNLSYLNPAAEILLEVSLQRVTGEPIANLFLENGEQLEGLQAAIDSGSPFTKRQTLIRTPSPQEYTVDYTVTPIHNGTQTSLLMEIQPLDRLLRISREETIISSQQTTKTLVRGLAHEIKNPLGGLRGAAQLLEKELNDDNLKDYTQIIIEEADRLTRLVDQLLGPKKAPQMAALNIHEVLERVFTLIEAESAGSIALKRDYDPSIPDVQGDKEQLIQAVLNIVRNAMQALNGQNNATIILRTRTHRQFTIGAVRHRLVVRIDIADNGPGIPGDLIDTIFLPMVTGRAEGTGLGLSISQSIINQHRGLVECASETGNTVFSLYIPLEPCND